MKRSLVVYDGSNPVFRAAADAVTGGAEDVEAVRWDAEAVQTFLEAQFDDRPFAFIVVDGDTVHVGDAAVEWVLERAAVAAPVVDGLKRAYGTGGGAFGRVLHGRTISELDGSFELAEDAASHLDAVREVREIPVREAPEDAH